MNHLFVPYEESLELKELGFDEPCNTCYDIKMAASYGESVFDYKNYNTSGYIISRPTYAQAFKWFREKHNIDELVQIEPLNIKYGYVVYQRKINSFVVSRRDFDTYEEAELACLRKLIEIVKVKQ